MPDVIVVGGGIIGAASAWELATRGASVALFERDEIAAGASGRNQGWLTSPDDPANEPLAAPSTEMFLEAADRAPLPVWIDREPVGYLVVELEGDDPYDASGEMQALDAAGVRELEPAIAPSVVRGWLADGGRRVDPQALTVGLALLAAEAGATIRHHLPVRALRIDRDRVVGVVTDEGVVEADTVVVAAGPWCTALLDAVGLRLPLTSARGWIVRLAPAESGVVRHMVERSGWRASEWRREAAGAIDARTFAASGVPSLGGALLNPHPSGSVLVGSSREAAVTPEPADPEVPRHQVADAIELVPALADADVRSAWWGVRPMSPDDRPMIGEMRDGLIVATGHGSEGVLQAGGTAHLVAALALGEAAPFDPTAFDPRRFTS